MQRTLAIGIMTAALTTNAEAQFGDMTLPSGRMISGSVLNLIETVYSSQQILNYCQSEGYSVQPISYTMIEKRLESLTTHLEPVHLDDLWESSKARVERELAELDIEVADWCSEEEDWVLSAYIVADGADEPSPVADKFGTRPQ